MASVSVVVEGPDKSDSFKQSLVLSLGPGILQFPLSRVGCVPTFQQAAGAAPGALSQLTLVQRRIHLLFSVVRTRGVANHRVCWSPAKKKRKATLSLVWPLQLSPKKLTNMYLLHDCKEQLPPSCFLQHPKMWIIAGGPSPRAGMLPILLFWVAWHMYLYFRVLPLQ